MKIYVITGHAKSGKTTFGNILRDKLKEYGYKPCVMQITSPLYHYAEDYFEWDSRQDEKPREFLQKFGIEILKEKLHKDTFLINRLEEDIDILSNFFDCFIITDARFKKELNELKEKYKDVVTIKLERTNYDDELSDEERSHVTEIEVDRINNVKYLVQNNSFKDLKEYAEMIISKEEDDII